MKRNVFENKIDIDKRVKKQYYSKRGNVPYYIIQGVFVNYGPRPR